MCKNDIHHHLNWLIPRFILVLETSDNEIRIAAIKNLSTMGYAIQPNFHQIWPFLSKLLTTKDNTFKLQISILNLIESWMSQIRVSSHTSAVLLPIVTLIDDPKSIQIRQEIMRALIAIVYSIGPDTNLLDYIQKVLEINRIRNNDFDYLCQCLHQMRTPWKIENDFEMFSIWREDFERVIPESPSPNMPNQEDTRFTLGSTDLQNAWDTAQRYTYDDWADWMRRFSLKLLDLSPSPSLRACHSFAELIPGMAKDLFPSSFISCWTRLNPVDQSKLVRSLEAAMASRTIPPEIITTLLNLVEFMEHDSDTQLPLDNRTLSALSLKCQAFAKALHYKVNLIL